VGDTDVDAPLILDEEIAYALGQEANARAAAARVARAIAAKFARKADKSVGDLKISFDQQYKHYIALAEELTRDAAIYGAIPYAGGISESDKQSVEDDTDRVNPSFKRRLHDNPGVASEDSDDICNANN
jgi:hypothetical protein